jgi:hypothetical protein
LRFAIAESGVKTPKINQSDDQQISSLFCAKYLVRKWTNLVQTAKDALFLGGFLFFHQTPYW